MARAFVSLGSNIEPDKNMLHAIRLLAARLRVPAVSTVYLTEPIGPPEQPPYFNCVTKLETDLPPLELKHKVLRTIEKELGRTRSSDKFAPRTIDLDLILYDETILSGNDLVLPDPDILKRPFLIAGLYELDPELVLPGSATPIAEAAKNIRYDSMKPLSEYTGILRRELLHEQ